MALFIIDRVARLLGWLSMGSLLALIVSMIYEVVSRYAFVAPNLWGYDLPWMFAGACFLLAAAVTLQVEGHVRIDFLSQLLPLRTQHLANFLFHLVLFLPAIGALTYHSTLQTWNAFVTDELEMMSAWQPLIWPFYLSITVGFAALWLQSLASAMRHAMGWRDPESAHPPGQAAPY